ncbi:hypothetical protein JB92DRAFT_3089526 [Gautieria morchelliformis]|nr:hypothetical protein JB92DRAFT_3136757 [Gautieria morchelliformis]KAF8507561.1 hypothetical protein JB92DRAFT_3089526 [Gautieria morchelliformis]
MWPAGDSLDVKNTFQTEFTEFEPGPYVKKATMTLAHLPVEIIAELYLLALSSCFPQTCKYIYDAIKSFPPSVHAYYILGRHPPAICWPSSKAGPTYIAGPPLTQALRYPLCNIPVLEAIRRIILLHTNIVNVNIATDVVELPKRVFRSLQDSDAPLDANSEPLPLLQFLWERRTQVDFAKPKSNSHNGYPLVRAVFARFTLLVRFLLDHGADPRRQDCLAVRVAIVKKDLMLVRMLIEFEPEPGASAKKRRRTDRVAVEPSMLDLAVKYDARDIVQYFMEEKGCIPNIKTLKAI